MRWGTDYNISKVVAIKFILKDVLEKIKMVLFIGTYCAKKNNSLDSMKTFYLFVISC